MEEKFNNIELRSEEVQEIMGHIPKRIIRYGITLIFSIIILLFAGSFFFKYPDILTAPIEITTQNPPVDLVAKTSANLSQVFVSDSQFVSNQTVIAVLKNSANFKHGLLLDQLIGQQSTIILDSFFLANFPDTLQLGDIQNAYTRFLKLRDDYFKFLALQYYPKKISSNRKKATELNKYVTIVQSQVALQEEDYKLSQAQFKRDSQLYVKEVISLSDFENAKKSLLQNRLSVANTQSSMVNANIQLQELQQQIIDLEIEYMNETENYENSLNENLQLLQSRLSWWLDTYVFISPINGRVAFSKYWSNHQFVNTGTVAFTILPEENSAIVGKITLPSQGAGKLKIGQRVNIKLDNFPFQEFGMITTQVNAISMVPSAEKYVVDVSLSDTLITNYGRELPFGQKMSGTAEIITEDLPLIARLFNPIKSVLKKHMSK